MPWNYEREPTLGIVEVVYEGKVSARDFRESTSELIGLEKREGLNRFLIDTTRMTLDQSTSLIDVYNLPTRQYVEEKADRLGRVALLPASSSRVREAVEFYETVCQNRGWMARIFSERREAIDWLAQRASEDYT